MERILAWKADRHGIDPLGATLYTNPVNGTQKTFANIAGHRDLAATECPGGTFYSTFPALRQAVATRIAATPTPTPTAAADADSDCADSGTDPDADSGAHADTDPGTHANTDTCADAGTAVRAAEPGGRSAQESRHRADLVSTDIGRWQSRHRLPHPPGRHPRIRGVPGVRSGPSRPTATAPTRGAFATTT
ncbi:MAG: hypothetical protein WKF78_03620 [Candidatus Limnocylindrales bacterium]